MEEKISLKEYAEEMYNERKRKLEKIAAEKEKKEKEEEEKRKANAEVLAKMCIRLFDISAHITDNPELWIKKLLLTQHRGYLLLSYMYQKDIANNHCELWRNTINGNLDDEEDSRIIESCQEFMQTSEEKETKIEYIVEALSDIQFLDVNISDDDYYSSVYISIRE